MRHTNFHGPAPPIQVAWVGIGLQKQKLDMSSEMGHAAACTRMPAARLSAKAISADPFVAAKTRTASLKLKAPPPVAAQTHDLEMGQRIDLCNPSTRSSNGRDCSGTPPQRHVDYANDPPQIGDPMHYMPGQVALKELHWFRG